MEQDLDINDELQLFMQDLCKGIKNYPKNVPPQTIQSIIALINDEIDQNMALHGRWDGHGTSLFSHGDNRWQELAPSTIESYQYKYNSRYSVKTKTGKTVTRVNKTKNEFEEEPTLIRSGRLRRSIAVTYKNDLTFELSANTPYAAIHQLGGGNIPARPYLVLSESAIQKIIKLVMKGLEQSIA